tara:strand:+ start:5622 stop:6236 length:615 start_codon:yes stop_codon:yes gene_type:complete
MSLINRIEKQGKDELRRMNNENFEATKRRLEPVREPPKRTEQKPFLDRSFVMNFSNLWKDKPFEMSPLYTDNEVDFENSLARFCIISSMIFVSVFNFNRNVPLMPKNGMWNSLLGSNFIIVASIFSVLMVYVYYKRGVYKERLRTISTPPPPPKAKAEEPPFIYDLTYQDESSGHIMYKREPRQPRPRQELNVLNTHLGSTFTK